MACNCGKEHRSLTDYWRHHNPNWRDTHVEPWKTGDFLDEETGIMFTASYCVFCKEVNEHDKNCVTYKPDWTPPVQTETSSFGAWSILGKGFHNPFGQLGQRGSTPISINRGTDDATQEIIKKKKEQAKKEQEEKTRKLKEFKEFYENFKTELISYVKTGSFVKERILGENEFIYGFEVLKDYNEKNEKEKNTIWINSYQSDKFHDKILNVEETIDAIIFEDLSLNPHWNLEKVNIKEKRELCLWVKDRNQLELDYDNPVYKRLGETRLQIMKHLKSFQENLSETILKDVPEIKTKTEVCLASNALKEYRNFINWIFAALPPTFRRSEIRDIVRMIFLVNEWETLLSSLQPEKTPTGNKKLLLEWYFLKKISWSHYEKLLLKTKPNVQYSYEEIDKLIVGHPKPKKTCYEWILVEGVLDRNEKWLIENSSQFTSLPDLETKLWTLKELRIKLAKIEHSNYSSGTSTPSTASSDFSIPIIFELEVKEIEVDADGHGWVLTVENVTHNFTEPLSEMKYIMIQQFLITDDIERKLKLGWYKIEATFFDPIQPSIVWLGSISNITSIPTPSNYERWSDYGSPFEDFDWAITQRWKKCKFDREGVVWFLENGFTYLDYEFLRWILDRGKTLLPLSEITSEREKFVNAQAKQGKKTYYQWCAMKALKDKVPDGRWEGYSYIEASENSDFTFLQDNLIRMWVLDDLKREIIEHLPLYD